jgi:hypothetical protein
MVSGLPLSLMVGGIVLLMAQMPTGSATRPADPLQKEERTCFQTGAHWDPGLQLGSDLALCYGVGPDIGARIAEWKAQGYRVGVMTGVSWGNYQDYLYGRFDGVNHVDEAQTDRYGNVISHGGDVYYMCPGKNYGKFLCLGVQRALDAGAESIFLEEPEFWVRAGYSAGFKREWQDYYKTPWVPPHSSPDAQFRASLLKYYLYRRALKQIFDYVHAYNKRTGKQIRCYVPTHSLINYAHWRIVSPESSLRLVGADGYIAQVWTGTARTPNNYDGVLRERTFETAFFEYGAMMNVVRAGGGRVWFLNDPVEDDPNHSWDDYQKNWEATVTASLMWPQVWRYEVMPWPERVWHGKYPLLSAQQRPAGQPEERVPIPQPYATELLTVINAMNDMKQSDVHWDCGTQGIGVMVSDTMMFERGEPVSSDDHLGSFFGLALPLLKRGMPAAPVQLETCGRKGALSPYRVLFMTYEGMKPLAPDVHEALAKWVRSGGVLVFVDNDDDPYNAIHFWWNEGGLHYATPREALFDRLGASYKGVPDSVLADPQLTPVRRVGKGALIWWRQSPAALTHSADGSARLQMVLERACTAAHLVYRATNYIVLRRGPYVVAAGLDESLPEPPHVVEGHFLDLFDPHLALVNRVVLTPGSRHLLLDVEREGQGSVEQAQDLGGRHKACHNARPAASPSPRVLAGACKILGIGEGEGWFHFYAEGPEGTTAVVCVRFPHRPKQIVVDGQSLPASDWAWEPTLHLLHLRFPNAAEGHVVKVKL